MSICQAGNGFSLDELVIHIPNFVMVRQLRIQYSSNLYPTGKNRNVRIYKKMAQEGIDFTTASSMVERVMRELSRRLKKTAYGWSDKGATKIARIILKRFTNARE